MCCLIFFLILVLLKITYIPYNICVFMASGRIGNDSLFLGLTRPSMILGVTYIFAGMNALASLMLFVLTSNFVYLLVVLPTLHGIAYLICLKEPLTLEMLIMKTSNFMKCKNRSFYEGTNSYDVY
ncbi:MAG: VirB3 family type IV secretion system protein [Rickettsiales bacterium]|nr:VirB3 family type IV secretion system protein [Rickettsiales bacterium]